MNRFKEGLRCQDVHSGLRNVDPNSPSLIQLENTQLVGMAGSLASLIRGQDVVTDAQALKVVAAEQLDINQFAFNEVIGLLADVGYIEGLKTNNGRILEFTESIPFNVDVYNDLGEAWEEKEPSEIEQQLVTLVDKLAATPLPRESITTDIAFDTATLPTLLELGETSHLVKKVTSSDGILYYSPFFGFENPKLILDLAQDHGTGQLAEALASVRGEQGVPVTADRAVLNDAVAHGLLLAPSVRTPHDGIVPFAVLPYELEHDYLVTKKGTLEKAMAVIACLRCGQYYGGYSDLSPNALVRVINKLLDPGAGYLMPHGSHERQYGLMQRAGLITFDADLMPGGSWVTPRFVDTEENREALAVARDLISHGERLEARGYEDRARAILSRDSALTAPMQTLTRTRSRSAMTNRELQSIVDAAFGKGIG